MPRRSSPQDADRLWIPLFTVVLVAMVMLVMLVLARPAGPRSAGMHIPSTTVAVSWGDQRRAEAA